MTKSFELYNKSPRPSMKHLNYFPVYDSIFEEYRGKPIVFVEVGVLDGGSLFMWRELFGPTARIIGIDLNPEALKWKDSGFEIYIGDQSDLSFWEKFYDEVGEIDLLLDDGGHTNLQQVTTVIAALPFVKDGGKIIVEDTHSGYLPEFGNPSRASINEFAKLGIDSMHARFPGLSIPRSEFSKAVWSISFFESITLFHINRNYCQLNSATSNNGSLLNGKPNSDFRYDQDSMPLQFLKLVDRIARVDFKSVGGNRTFLRPFNILIDHPLKRSALRTILLPFHLLSKSLILIDLRARNFVLRHRFQKYFRKLS